ncbi:MAG: cold shock domain-containing protein [Bacteroidota bacterium]
MQTGNIKFFNESKGFGFITSTEGNDCFLHVSALNGETVREGDAVTYDIEETPKGISAKNVQITKRA